MLPDKVLDVLKGLDKEIGRQWNRHARAARASDDLLRVPIAEGAFTTKIDGWMHAFTVTNQSIVKFARDPQAGLDIERVTSWTGGDAALRYGRYQADFHWEIDTRLWQYTLYLVFARRAYRDAVAACQDLTESEKASLLFVIEEFLDEALVAYVYRTETIERARRFAPHPDPTAGSTRHGYTYGRFWDVEEIPFEELPLDFLGDQVRAEAGPRATKRAPRPFPPAERWPLEGEDARAACRWLDAARKRGLVDEWLCALLGDRWVPTRFDGWMAGIREAMNFWKPSIGGKTLALDRKRFIAGHDLADYAVRFGICQAEFYRRLEGETDQLTALLEALCDGMIALAGEEHATAVKEFLARAGDAARLALPSEPFVDDEILPELQVARPIHPRYAPVDPMEPLPWQQANTEQYLQKMARMGYIL